MNFSVRNKTIGRLLILVAMQAEEDAIISKFPVFSKVEINKNLGIFGKEFKIGELMITVINSGIGIVNAGLAVAFAFENSEFDAVILLGVAGALKSHLEIGEVVLAKAVYQHDSIFSKSDGYEPMAPGFPYLSVEPEDRESPRFDTDSDIYQWLISKKSSFKAGVILSGSEFVGSAEAKAKLALHYPDALAVEMEAAGVALVAKKLGLPFAVIKTIADRLNPDGSISSDYKKFLKAAADSAADIFTLIVASNKNV